MTFKYLYDMSVLKMPEINFRIFTTADDILPARREVTKHRVRAVSMADICFNTTRGLDVP